MSGEEAELRCEPQGCVYIRFLWNGCYQSGCLEYEGSLHPKSKRLCLVRLFGQLPMEAPQKPLKKPIL